MTSGGPGQPTSLPMGSWPKLIKVTMPYDDTCASRRITADLLRWSIDAEPAIRLRFRRLCAALGPRCFGARQRGYPGREASQAGGQRVGSAVEPLDVSALPGTEFPVVHTAGPQFPGSRKLRSHRLTLAGRLAR